MSFNTEGVMPLIRGVVMKFTEDEFNKRDGVFRSYDKDWADYGVAGLPLAATWMMKLAGVESRSTYKRMFFSNIMSLALSAGLVKTLKLTIDERRPDLKCNDGFPSGHSSFAFVGATILHREYGHHSPWISVGGYAAATATQMLRVKHNRHWAHDTFVGAGIGVVSTNLAYYITDCVFGESGINRPRLAFGDLQRLLDYSSQPTSLSFMSGSEIGDRRVEYECLDKPDGFDGKAKVYVGAALTAGVEGSWFVSNNVSFDAMLKLTTAKCKLAVAGSNVTDVSYSASNLDFYRMGLGVRYSYLFGLNHRFAFRVFAGMRMNDRVSFQNLDVPSLVFSIPTESKFDSGFSIMYDCVTMKKCSYGFNFDYYRTASDVMPRRYGVSTVWKILL
jgi:acid phosphatase family membrane protein YuiD